MEKYQKLFIYIFSLIAVYYLTSGIPGLPDEVLGVASKKLIKAFIGLAMGAGALWIYFKKAPSSGTDVTKNNAG